MTLGRIAENEQLLGVIGKYPHVTDTIPKAMKINAALKEEGIVPLSVSGIAFLMTLGYVYDEQKADDFFEQIRTGIGFSSEKAPARQFRRYLSSKRKGFNRDEVIAVGIKAWNAFATGADRGTPYYSFKTEGENPEAFPVAIGTK